MSQVANRRRDWIYVVVGLALLLPSLEFYLNAQPRDTQPTAYEIARAEPLKPQGFFGEQMNWLAVKRSRGQTLNIQFRAKLNI